MKSNNKINLLRLSISSHIQLHFIESFLNKHLLFLIFFFCVCGVRILLVCDAESVYDKNTLWDLQDKYLLVKTDKICTSFSNFWIAAQKKNTAFTFAFIPVLQEQKKSFQVWMRRVIFTWLLSAKKPQMHLIFYGVNRMKRLVISISLRLKQKEISKSYQSAIY